MNWIFSALLISVGSSLIVALGLRQFLPRWPRRRTLIVAAAIAPGLPCLALFALEVGGGLYHAYVEPDAPMMIGVFAMTFPLILISMWLNLMACWLLSKVVRFGPRD